MVVTSYLMQMIIVSTWNAPQVEIFIWERPEGSTSMNMMNTKKHYKDCVLVIAIEYASGPKRKGTTRR